MTVLLTRPLEDSLALATLIDAAGYNSFIEPMFHVSYLSNNNFDKALSEYGNNCSIILTSKHAEKSIRLMECNNNCFRISGTPGITNAHGLLEHIKAHAIKDKILLYPRGKKISLNIKPILEASGFCVKEFIVYETIEREALSDELITKLVSNQIKVILFYSRNTVDIFASLLTKASIKSLLPGVVFLSISKELQFYIRNKMKSSAVEAFSDKDGLFTALKKYTAESAFTL